jgi:flagellar hook-length control protein FliK
MAALQDALRQLNRDASDNSGGNDKQAMTEIMPRSAQSKNAQHFVPFVAAEKNPALAMDTEQTVTSAAFVKETDMADNISRIVENISARFAEDAQEFTVSLKPEHLGKLSIKLIMDSDGLRAQIKAADSSVSGLIRSELNTLSDLLKDKGIPVTQIDVSYDTAAFLTDARQGNSGQYPGSSSKNRRTYTLNGTEPYGTVPTLTDSQQLMIQGSSIEFQA